MHPNSLGFGSACVLSLGASWWPAVDAFLLVAVGFLPAAVWGFLVFGFGGVGLAPLLPPEV